MIILSHRGLDLDRQESLPENSMASFAWAESRGFGVELDLQMSGDHKLLIAHDADVGHWTHSQSNARWNELSSKEILALELAHGAICWLEDVLALAQKNPDLYLALHIKSPSQNSLFMSQVGRVLSQRKNLLRRLLIFDLHLQVAADLKAKLPEVQLAPSVAHESDIRRFQKLVGGTLFSVDDVLSQRKVFDWVWLDEWDTLPAKTLYNVEVCDRLREKDYKIAMISPELHRTEGHADSRDMQALEARWRQMIHLKPDAICTDYPVRFKSLLASC